MAPLRFYEVRVRLLSPAIITRRRTANGFIGPLDHIPAQTLRGALVSSLFLMGLIGRERMRKEEEDPTVFASPAYPIRGGAKTYPAHPFLMECKVCVGRGEMELVGEPDLGKVEQALAEERELDLVPVECGMGHRALRPLHPRGYLALEGGRFTRLRERRGEDAHRGAERSHSVSVAISRGRAAGIKGLLYHYEFLMPGGEFWATIALPEDLSLPREGLTVMMGRGVSRGFGRAKVEVLGEKNVSFSGRARVLYALSPTLGASDGPSTYPPSLDMRSAAGRFGLEVEGLVRILRAYGRTVWVSAGWSMTRGEPRPRVLCRAPGSLLLMENWVEGNASRALALLGLTGTATNLNGQTLFGFNHLLPVGCL